jgi:integrase/recombinase XerD
MAGGEGMMAAIDTYLAMRRATGFTLRTQEYLLRSFARFAGDRQQAHIRSATAIDWASQAVSLAQRHARYQTVCRFATYVRLEDDRHDCPPANYFGYHRTRRVPHIYSAIEIHRLIRAAEQLVPTDSLRPFSYAALISLLAATGLRISEALHLLISDITPDGLLIRKTKFQKTRLVPLHQTAVSGLRRYLEQRQRTRCGGDHVFVSNTGLPLAYWKVQGVFRKLLKTAGLIPLQGRAPRLHDFRHTFAVRALEASPTGRRRIGRHMVALATYLGHVNIDATYWYLQSTPELLSDIAAASETFVDGGQR